MKGPWYITPTATRDYLKIRGWRDDGANFERAIGHLIEIAQEMVASGRQPVIGENGHLRYRTGRTHGRMGLVVSTVLRHEGDLPQLVAVMRSGVR